ncbi:MAG: CHRD domain-containing protein [Burkholderiaceae bacterium]
MESVGKVTLSGAAEVPANGSSAAGGGIIQVSKDHMVSGSIQTRGVDGTAAHIHLAAKGVNGPVIVPLTKTADGTWSVPAGVTLTNAQYAAYVAGNTYVNVHSAAMPAGEIRGQISSN